MGWPLLFQPITFFTMNGRRRLPDSFATVPYPLGFRIISPVLSGKWVWQSQTRCDIMSNGDWNINFKRVLFRLTASGVPPPGAVFFFCLLLRSVLSKTFILSGIYLIEQIEQMLYYLNLKSKKKYKKVTLKENGKKMCSICSNLGLRIKCLICPSYLWNFPSAI